MEINSAVKENDEGTIYLIWDRNVDRFRRLYS